MLKQLLLLSTTLAGAYASYDDTSGASTNRAPIADYDQAKSSLFDSVKAFIMKSETLKDGYENLQQSFEQSVREKDMEILQLRGEIRNAEGDRDSYKQSLEVAKNELQNTQQSAQENADLKTRIETLDAEKTRTESLISGLQSELTNLNQKISQDKNTYQLSLGEKDKEITGLLTLLKTAQAQQQGSATDKAALEKAQGDLEKLQSDLNTSKAESESKSSELQEKINAVIALTTENGHLKAANSVLSQESDSRVSLFGDALSERDEIFRQFGAGAAAVNAKQKSDFDRHLAAQDAERTDSLSSLKDTQMQLVNAKAELVNTKAKLEKEQDKNADSTRIIEIGQKKHAEEKQAMQARIDAADARAMNYHGEAELLRTSHTTTTARVSELENQIQTLSESVAKKDDQIAERDDKIATISEERDAAVAAKDVLGKEMNVLKASLEKLSGTLAGNEDAKAELKARIAQMEAEATKRQQEEVDNKDRIRANAAKRDQDRKARGVVTAQEARDEQEREYKARKNEVSQTKMNSVLRKRVKEAIERAGWECVPGDDKVSDDENAVILRKIAKDLDVKDMETMEISGLTGEINTKLSRLGK